MEKGKGIDLVILDMIMPGISGGRTFDILRGINPDVAVILASGYSAEGEARAIINRGCRGFIQKPFHLQALSRNVREVLNDKGEAKLRLRLRETTRQSMGAAKQSSLLR